MSIPIACGYSIGTWTVIGLMPIDPKKKDRNAQDMVNCMFK